MLPAKGFVDTIREVAPEVILIGGGEVLPAYLQGAATPETGVVELATGDVGALGGG